eukprot:1336985-Pleurochrysis_carterae.AAC.1
MLCSWGQSCVISHRRCESGRGATWCSGVVGCVRHFSTCSSLESGGVTGKSPLAVLEIVDFAFYIEPASLRRIDIERRSGYGENCALSQESACSLAFSERHGQRRET